MGTCSKCGGYNDRDGQRYCRGCHAKYMREHRKPHFALSDGEKIKSRARAYANTHQRRGLLTPEPCIGCGSLDVEKHHDDYSKPLEVTWVCRECHLLIHS